MFNPQNFKNKKCLIIGYGKSGMTAAVLVSKKLTSDITVSDIKNIKTDFNFISEKDVDESFIKKIDFAIKSPGISRDNRIIKMLERYSKPIFSEVEVALSFSKTKNTIMITGTNGKSTTAYLTHLIMDAAVKKKGFKSILAGNIGIPLSQQVIKASENDWLVIEISSYQLEDSTFIKPSIAAITNITPDHIEHHLSMENYIKSKLKIFSWMDSNSSLIINMDDRILKKIKSSKFKILRFSLKNRKADIYIKDGKMYIKKINKYIEPAKIPGEHNLYNQMTAILCAMEAGADLKIIQKVISSFKGLEHRIEFVKEINGVKYYNDSKATNVDSTLVSLKSLGKTKNIHLILGGVHKNSPYSPLIPLIKKYVKCIYTIGLAHPIIEKELCDYIKIISAKTLDRAIKLASENAEKGDIVLLSPACASFDQFKNFEERGKKFKKYVSNL